MKAYAIVLFVMVLIAGCGTKEAGKPIAAPAEQAAQPAAEPTDVTSQVTAIENLEQELDSSAVADVDRDLASVDW